MMISKVDFLELVGTSTKNPALIEIDAFHRIPPANLKHMLAKFWEYAMKERRKIHYLKADKTNPHPWHCCLCQDIKTLIHSCLIWPLEEIYNLIFEHFTYSAILVPKWNT